MYAYAEIPEFGNVGTKKAEREEERGEGEYESTRGMHKHGERGFHRILHLLPRSSSPERYFD